MLRGWFIQSRVRSVAYFRVAKQAHHMDSHRRRRGDALHESDLLPLLVVLDSLCELQQEQDGSRCETGLKRCAPPEWSAVALDLI